MQANSETHTVNSSSVKLKTARLLQKSKVAKIAEIIIIFLVAFIFVKLFERSGPENQVYNMVIIGIANILMLILVWLGIKIRGESLAGFGFMFKKFGWKFALRTFLQSILVMILAMAGFIIGSIVMANITGIPESSDFSNYNYLQNNFGMLLLTLAAVYIISSFGEEVVYRAFLITRISQLGLNSKSGKIIAVILSAVVFGLAHYSWGPAGIVQTGFMGLALGLCYIYMKNRIWVLILAHAYMDTVLMVQMYLR
jgi:membrane protease YdiL (CAAX protease family)